MTVRPPSRKQHLSQAKYFPIQVVHQEMLAFVVDPIPCGGFQVRRTCERRAGAEGLARAGQDYDFVFEVARDVGEQIREVLMRAAAPFELLAVGVKRDLQSVSESEVAEVTQRIESSLTRTSAHVTEIAEMSPARV